MAQGEESGPVKPLSADQNRDADQGASSGKTDTEQLNGDMNDVSYQWFLLLYAYILVYINLTVTENLNLIK